MARASKRGNRESKLNAVKGKVFEATVFAEMTALLQRVRTNKSKRTAMELVKEGPLRVSLVALDVEGRLEGHRVDGPFSVQCLLGRVLLSIEGRGHRMTTGDLVVAGSAGAHDVTAEEASVLMFTVASEG